MRGAELLHERTAFARRQRREQRLGLVFHGVLLPGEGAPVLLQLGRVLAAQQRVLPFLHLGLEVHQHVGDRTLVRMLRIHIDLVDGHRLVQAIDAHEGGAHQGGQDAGEGQRQFQLEFHGEFGKAGTGLTGAALEGGLSGCGDCESDARRVAKRRTHLRIPFSARNNADLSRETTSVA